MLSRRPGRPSKNKIREKESTSIIGNVGSDEEEEINRISSRDEVPVLETHPECRRRGRGRPPKQPKSLEDCEEGGGGGRGDCYDVEGGKGAGGVPIVVMRRLVKCLPEMEGDEEGTECSECGKRMTGRQFRLHNIQYHVNTATTREEKEGIVMDHKYFSRKLNEFKRLTKMTVFACPRNECKSSFKSTLGLAYHMNTCGRSEEELAAVLLECEICHQKLTLPNMQWHRKTHEERGANLTSSISVLPTTTGPGHKRRSAVRARKSFKRMSLDTGDSREKSKRKTGDDDNDDEWEADDDNEDRDDDDHAGDERSSTYKKREKGKPILDLDKNDYTALATRFLDTLDEKGYQPWDDPCRVCDDPLLALRMPDNPLFSPPPGTELEEYLPDHKTSVEFMCTTGEDKDGKVTTTTNYHELNWFEGESVEVSYFSSSGKNITSSSSVHHVGGPVLSMAWHPSGKLFAVAVGHSLDEELDSMVSQKRKSCIQIYRRQDSVLSLQLVLGVKWGYATHIQWSTFCPDIMDSYNAGVESCFDDIEIYARLGYLAMASEDSIVRIMSLGIQDLKVPPNYEYRPPFKIKVYTKTPEIELQVDESVIEDPLGNAVRFDWHDGNKYFAIGYANGFIAIYDLQTSSSLLVQKTASEEGDVTVINPFWTFHGHRLAVRGVEFDPMNPRYLVTCSQDRQMKVWDLDTRMERDNKRSGICLDMCWVRGWMHQVVSFENIVSYQSAMHNYVRIFQTGSSVGKPSSAEIFNVTSVGFYHGLTAQGTDDGKVNVTYYDWFWRDCDFERNRKKKNLAVLSSVEVDRSSYQPLSPEDFSVEVKKISKSVLNSKLYQRLAVNEEEGIYSISLEAKFGGMNIFDPLPNPDDDEEEETDDSEGEEEEDGEEDTTIETSETQTEDEGKDEKLFPAEEDDNDKSTSDMVLSDVINNAVTRKDGLIPIYDVQNPKGAPKLNIVLTRKRPSTAVPVEGLEVHQVEEYIRFHSYIRVNKVAWSPNGDVLAVGYRNGLITLLPGTFDSIYQS